MKTYDVIIIGAGAAGLMCAITASQQGRRVVVLDHANKVGKKILMSGGGRCNFTNLYVEPENFLSHNSHFCKSALSQYTQWDFIDLVTKHEIPYHEKKSGQLFCDNKSKDILDMLLSECRSTNIDIITRCDIKEIKQKEGFEITSSLGTFTGESLVIATGGLSIPTMGATNFGFQIAEQFQLKTYLPIPGLVPFTFTDHHKDLFESLSGVSLTVELTTQCGMVFTEDLLFTHRGLSGPVVLQASSYWQQGEEITINLLPQVNCIDWLAEQKQSHPKQQLKTLLTHLLPKNFSQAFLEFHFPDHSNTAINQLGQKQLTALAELLNGWTLKPSGTEGYRTAEVTLGGVDTDELSSKTMESKKHPGLYFIGEVVDVTGHLGGFNFQWAWSSGYVAGLNV